MQRRAPSVQKFRQGGDNQVDFDEANMFHPSAVGAPQKARSFSIDGTLAMLAVTACWIYLVMDLTGVELVLTGLPGQ